MTKITLITHWLPCLLAAVVWLALFPATANAQAQGTLWQTYIEGVRKAIAQERYPAAAALARAALKEAEKFDQPDPQRQDPRWVISYFLTISLDRLKPSLGQAQKDAMVKYDKPIRIDVPDSLGPELLSIANPLDKLAHFHLDRGAKADESYRQAEEDSVKKAAAAERDFSYGIAEQLFLIEWAIRQQVQGPEHPDTAWSFSMRAFTSYKQGKGEEAARRFEEALHMWDMQIKSAIELCEQSYHFTQSRPLLSCSEAQWREVGSQPEVLVIWSRIYWWEQKKYDKAETLLKQALHIQEARWPGHLNVALSLLHLARLYADEDVRLQSFPSEQEKYAEAERLFKRALAMLEQVFGPDHLQVVDRLEEYADLLRKMHRKAEAAEFTDRIQASRARQESANPLKRD